MMSEEEDKSWTEQAGRAIYDFILAFGCCRSGGWIGGEA
jgi:hypothetical protein